MRLSLQEQCEEFKELGWKVGTDLSPPTTSVSTFHPTLATKDPKEKQNACSANAANFKLSPLDHLPSSLIATLNSSRNAAALDTLYKRFDRWCQRRTLVGEALQKVFLSAIAKDNTDTTSGTVCW